MLAKHFRWLFVGMLMALLLVGVVAEPTSIGVWRQWSDDRYLFGGGTRPWALMFAPLIIGLYLLLMYSVPVGVGKPLLGVVRRLVAFWLDFVLAIMAVAPIFGVLPAFTEWRRTGVFKWVFERPNAAPGDGLLIAAQVLVISVALLFYYAFPLVRRRPSPGTCIAGYQVVADNGVTLTLRAAILRTLLGVLALMLAYFAPFIGRDKKNGKFWLDKVFGTRAVMLS